MANADRIAHLNHPTRRRILLAAEQHFAADGYDAARVDEIAASAEVSKSHLYYHFAAKAELLSGLVELRTAELLAAKVQLLADTDTAELFSSEEHLAALLRDMFVDLLMPRRDFVRIVLVEAIRNPEATEPVFAALNAVLEDTSNRLADLKVILEPRTKALWFYFGIIPALYYVALGDRQLAAATPADLARDLARMELATLGFGADPR